MARTLHGAAQEVREGRATAVELLDECLAHIDEVWTDMRPLSLRRAMEQAAGS